MRNISSRKDFSASRNTKQQQDTTRKKGVFCIGKDEVASSNLASSSIEKS